MQLQSLFSAGGVMLHMDAVRRLNGGQFPLVNNAKITNMKNVLQHAFVGKMKSQGKSTAAETVLFCTGFVEMKIAQKCFNACLLRRH